MKEKCISVCNDFVKALSDIKEENKSRIDYDKILNILDCIHLEENYHLKVRFPHFRGHGDKSWFYCYKGDTDTYEEEYNNRVREVDDFIICYCYDEIHNIFNHLEIEPTYLGAWQAYLMSTATHFLPTCWHGGYSKRVLVFHSNDILERKSGLFWLERPDNIPDLGELPPSVTFNGNKAIVKACYWNSWSGLVRETVEIRFLGNRAYFLDSPQKEILFKYDCKIRY